MSFVRLLNWIVFLLKFESSKKKKRNLRVHNIFVLYQISGLQIFPHSLWLVFSLDRVFHRAKFYNVDEAQFIKFPFMDYTLESNLRTHF